MSDNRFTWVNGRLMPKEQAAISPFDHGFLYGDGCFEGIRIYSGKVFKLEEHLDRLYASAKVMLINIDERISRADLTKAIFESINANEIYDRGYIRLVVTRGAGDLGINPRKCTEPPTVVIIVDTLTIYPAEDYEKGIPVIICSTRKLNRNGYKARVKSLNYLNNIYAIMEANRVGAKEGIMLTDDGFVAEATVDNIFVVTKGVLRTPPCVIGALDGITRRTVIDLALEHGVPFREELMTPYDLYTADEVFLTGTGAELIPVTKVDDCTIGTGAAGPVTGRILGWFRAIRELQRGSDPHGEQDGDGCPESVAAPGRRTTPHRTRGQKRQGHGICTNGSVRPDPDLTGGPFASQGEASMWEKFTPSALTIIKSAAREARLSGHEAVGTPHLLVSLLQQRTDDIRAAQALRDFDLRPDEVYRELIAVNQAPPAAGKLSFAPEAETALRAALAAARREHFQQIGGDQLLIGLLQAPDTTAAQWLQTRGITAEAARLKLLELALLEDLDFALSREREDYTPLARRCTTSLRRACSQAVQQALGVHAVQVLPIASDARGAPGAERADGVPQLAGLPGRAVVPATGTAGHAAFLCTGG